MEYLSNFISVAFAPLYCLRQPYRIHQHLVGQINLCPIRVFVNSVITLVHNNSKNLGKLIITKKFHVWLQSSILEPVSRQVNEKERSSDLAKTIRKLLEG